jgi:predicted amino acid racemase
MAYITLNTDKLKHNHDQLDNLFKTNDLEWAVVSKMLCGNKKYLEALIGLGIRQICDSRVGNLRTIKSIAPDIETYFIKPAAKRNAQKVVMYADVSFNTSYETVKALSAHAVALNKQHKIVIMVELGERREGVMRNQLPEFYAAVAQLPNIEVVGLGTNHTCMFGVLPDYEKLSRLCKCKDLIKETFGDDIPLISGGASVTIPLIEESELPEGVNHFRVGETLFLGTDVYNNVEREDLYQDVFTLHAEIIELNEKPYKPSGKMGLNLMREKYTQQAPSRSSMRAIVDVGLIDIEAKHLVPDDISLKIIGASSDMMVVDLGENDEKYKVGDDIKFRMDYMGILRIMHSAYVEKRIESGTLHKARISKAEAVLN